MGRTFISVELAAASLCPFQGGKCRHWFCMAWRGDDKGEPGFCALIEREGKDDDRY